MRGILEGRVKVSKKKEEGGSNLFKMWKENMNISRWKKRCGYITIDQQLEPEE